MTNNFNPYMYQNQAYANGYFGYQNMVPMNTQMMQNGQMMQQNQPAQPAYIQGKIVNSEDDIKPIDVPMNGSWSFFPLNDGSAIIAKSWNSNGELGKSVYVKMQDTQTVQEKAGTSLDDIMARLDKIDETLAAWSK